ncbi:MAG: DUF2786 domain-containing protein [Thalassobaculaceae bacterium]
MTDRDKILDRIAKLKRLAADGAATEGEVQAALDRVRALMAEYGLDDVDLAAAQMGTEAVDLERSRRQLVDNLMGAIAAACGCVAVLSRGSKLRVEYFGPDPMPTIAVHLHDVCYRAASHLTKAYRGSAEYRRRRTAKTRSEAVRAFQQGVLFMIRRKLREIGWLPQQRVDELYLSYGRRHGGELVEQKALNGPGKPRRYANAAGAGLRAGQSIDLHAPVTGSRSAAIAGPDA